jgi:biotin transport system substrate-specific component
MISFLQYLKRFYMVISVDFSYENSVTSPFAKYKDTLLQVVGASLFIALCSQIKINLPFSLIPITLQTFAILLVGANLGSKKGAAAVLLYLSQAMIGLPVLAGGDINPLFLLGPKGGYYVGFLVQAYCMGWFTERMKEVQPQKLFFVGLLACSLQLGLGAIQLASFVGWNSVLLMGVYPFIFGEILKVIGVCKLTNK